jgi:hypothetical protein
MALPSKGSKGPLPLIICSFYRKGGVNGFLESLGHHYLMLRSCGNTRGGRPLLSLMSFQVFSHISLHDLLGVNGDWV